jgi:hypothetical protein
MAANVHDHVVDEVNVTHNLTTKNNATENHLFRAIEHIGQRGYHSEATQRIAAVVMAVLICTAMYGVLYFGMH